MFKVNNKAPERCQWPELLHCKLQKQPPEVFYKKTILKYFEIHGKTCVKEKLQRRCFSVNIAKLNYCLWNWELNCTEWIRRWSTWLMPPDALSQTFDYPFNEIDLYQKILLKTNIFLMSLEIFRNTFWTFSDNFQISTKCWSNLMQQNLFIPRKGRMYKEGHKLQLQSKHISKNSFLSSDFWLRRRCAFIKHIFRNTSNEK